MQIDSAKLQAFLVARTRATAADAYQALDDLSDEDKKHHHAYHDSVGQPNRSHQPPFLCEST